LIGGYGGGYGGGGQWVQGGVSGAGVKREVYSQPEDMSIMTPPAGSSTSTGLLSALFGANPYQAAAAAPSSSSFLDDDVPRNDPAPRKKRDERRAAMASKIKKIMGRTPTSEEVSSYKALNLEGRIAFGNKYAPKVD